MDIFTENVVSYSILLSFYLRGITLKVSTRKRLSGVSTLVFILYISLVIYFVFFSDHYGRVTGFTEFRYNLTPFAEIRRYLTYKEFFTWENLITNLAGNILAFAPFGVLVPLMRRRTGFWYTTFITLFFSLFIETVQLATRVGVFDVDDLIMNTVGGVCGYLTYRLIRLWYRFREGTLFEEEEPIEKKRRRKKQLKTYETVYQNPTAKVFRQSEAKRTEVNGRKR